MYPTPIRNAKEKVKVKKSVGAAVLLDLVDLMSGRWLTHYQYAVYHAHTLIYKIAHLPARQQMNPTSNMDGGMLHTSFLAVSDLPVCRYYDGNGFRTTLAGLDLEPRGTHLHSASALSSC